MILYHVPHSPCLIVERAAALHAKVFGHGDLHALHIVPIPKRFQQRISEAEEQHVMHGLLSQIMVDAEDSVFVEGAEQNAVEPLCTDKVRPERLLHNDARCLRNTAGLPKLLHDGGEQRWRNRQIERRLPRRTECLADCLEGGGIVIITVDVTQQIAQFFERSRIYSAVVFETVFGSPLKLIEVPT